MPPSAADTARPPNPGLPFLLSQVGAHVSSVFGERIAALGLKPYHAGILGVLEHRPGITQQALADLLGMFPSRLVGLLDDLEQGKLIQRRASPTDRRVYAVHLTKPGQSALAKIGKVAAQLQDDLCAGLKKGERELLAGLLTRIVEQRKITPGVHPGYRKIDSECG